MKMSGWSTAAVCSLLLLMMMTIAAPPAAAQGTTGAVAGTVNDGVGQPLPGATVTLAGTALTSTTDLEGRFRLAPVPAGERTLRVAYLGFDPETLTVQVEAGTTARIEVRLAPAERFFGTVTVVGQPLLEGQAKALNQRKNAPNIVNVVAREQMERFPDPNSAEVTQRVPGVAIQRDQGEGRYVLIRGTEPRLNSMMIDGERIPSPEGDVRQVALDVIPSDLLESIEVSKALTPEMDGDAIGGGVNLVMKRAPERRVLSASVGAGYNDINGEGSTTGAFTWGDRFADGAFGVMFSGSYFDTDRGSENFEAEYDDGFLGALEYRDYTINRERIGLATNLDWVLSPDSTVSFKGTWNHFDDQEYRRLVNNAVEDDAIERELKDRFESQEIYSLSLGGEHAAFGDAWLRWKLLYASAEEDEPDALYSLFLQEDVQFDPNVTPDLIDPDNIRANPLNEDLAAFVLDEMVLEDNLTTQEDVVGSVDLDLPFKTAGGLAGLWRFGVKYRDISKERDNEAIEFGPEEDYFLADFLDGGFDSDALIADGRYPIGPFQSPGAMRDLLRSGIFEAEKDFEEDTADYEASEQVAAAYLASELYLSERLMLLPGLRWEHTDSDYTGYEVLFDEEGDYVSTEPLTGDESYDVLLPHLHLRYRLDDDSNLRAALTRSYARPNFFDLAPYNLVLDEDREIERGNPALEPTTSWNGDLMYERFFSSVGLVSAGVFYKTLEDFIYPYRSTELRDGEEFDVLQPRNGDSADLLGFELAYENRFLSAPAPWSGFGLYANYTWIDSEASFPDRGDTTVPGQSKNVGNLAVSYEAGGFSIQVSLNYRDEFLDEVAEEAAEDVWIDEHSQLDLSAGYRFPSRLRVYLQLNNLTDEPFRAYIGHPDRPIQEEFYSWWGVLGVSYDF